MAPAAVTQLASRQAFRARWPQFDSMSDGAIDDILSDATEHIEDRCSRRLVAFTTTETQDAQGIDPTEYGDASAQPLPMVGAIGLSKAVALGATDLVRHFWVDQYAPVRPELWTYDVTQLQLQRTYGDVQDLQLSTIQGPYADSGEVRVQVGTFMPEGTKIVVTYSGGYTAVPGSLRRACLLEAAVLAVFDAEPQLRKDMSIDAIQLKIVDLIAPWVR